MTGLKEKTVMKEKTGSMEKYVQRGKTTVSMVVCYDIEQGKIVKAKDEGKIRAKVQEANT